MKPQWLLISLFLFHRMPAIAQSPTTEISLYFASDSSAVTKTHTTLLDSLLPLNNKNDISEIHLSGYCDDVDDSIYNLQLSGHRVRAVKNYLIQWGIDSNLIVEEKAYGENKPVNNNTNEAERAINRRVDIIIEYQLKNSDALRNQIDNAKVGEKIVLKNMNFYPGSSRIIPESIPVMDTLYEIMKDHPGLVIELVGHICCISDATAASYKNGDGFNMDTGTFTLSYDRAFSVRNYLVKKGIETKRILYIGKGGSEKLVNPELTDADRQANRRVEVWVVGK